MDLRVKVQERIERDFMGLRVKVKQEVPEEITDSASVRGPTMQWSFSNKGSVPPFLSFEASKEDKPKTGFEALASAGLVTITTTEAVDSVQKPCSSIMQKNMALEKQAGTHYIVTTYPPNPFESRILPVTTQTNQTVMVAMSPSPVHHPFISSAGHNLISSTISPPLSIPSSVPAKNATSPIVGTTELRNTFKTSAAPVQLTIFYAGSVCVYDDVSPEKAQAIMLLAGNGHSVASSPVVPAAPVQAPAVRPSIVDSFVVNQSYGIKPRLPTPISIASHSSSASGRVSVIPNDIPAVRTIGTLRSPPNKGESSKTVNSVGSVPVTAIPSAAPQFRKASLARFLEKRKERVVASSPYTINQSQDCSTPASFSRSLPVNSSGSCPLPTID